MVTQEPTLTLNAIPGRVPPHRRAHAWHSAHDELVDAAPDIVFLTWHGRDVGLHVGVAALHPVLDLLLRLH